VVHTETACNIVGLQSDFSSRLGVRRKADDLALQRKNISAKSEEGKPGCNLAEYSKEGYA
jgi:hypothetical protein